MPSLVTVVPSSCRNRFSSRIRSEKGSRVRLTPLPSSAFRRKKLYFCENEGEVNVDRLLNESGCDWVDMVSSPKRAIEGARVGGRSQDSNPQHQRPKSKMFNGGMLLAAAAVSATVAEALRGGKSPGHRQPCTTIGGP